MITKSGDTVWHCRSESIVYGEEAILSSFLRVSSLPRTLHALLSPLRGRGGAVFRLRAFHLDEPGSIPGGVAPRFPHVGIVPDVATGRWVFSGISLLSPPLHSGGAPYLASIDSDMARQELSTFMHYSDHARAAMISDVENLWLWSPTRGNRSAWSLVLRVGRKAVQRWDTEIGCAQPASSIYLIFSLYRDIPGAVTKSRWQEILPILIVNHTELFWGIVLSLRDKRFQALRPANPTDGEILSSSSIRFRLILACVTEDQWSAKIWAALNIRALRIDEGEVSAGVQGRGKREIPEKTRRPVASFGTIPQGKNPGAIPQGTEPGSPR
ncbi:hypothetical protein PR048_015187 [Dryococelus australis]|uniref:Uncharacterized protein n=1 Tax=Dryococelus australis TaxID=614101 RepID=A0ABQ9HGH8_9NEOP|nr:hypothetical protein PR048_015187 [Dryococelus australis]